MKMNSILRTMILILLIGCITNTIAGPEAYAACVNTCESLCSNGLLMWGTALTATGCATICAPLLMATTP